MKMGGLERSDSPVPFPFNTPSRRDGWSLAKLQPLFSRGYDSNTLLSSHSNPEPAASPPHMVLLVFHADLISRRDLQHGQSPSSRAPDPKERTAAAELK